MPRIAARNILDDSNRTNSYLPEYRAFFPALFRLTVFFLQFVLKFVVLLSLHRDLKVIFNSPGRVASLPLGSQMEGLPHFTFWKGVFYSISSADDRTVTPL